MKKILIATDFTETERQQVEVIAAGHQVIYKSNLEVTPADMKEVNIVMGNLSLRHFADVPDLEWIQLQTAGTDGYLKPGVLPAGVLLTNVTGAFGESIAEYVIGAALALKNHFHTYFYHQTIKHWQKIPVSNLKGSTVVILGLGDIGRETAKRMKAMGAYVVAVKRRKSEKPEYVDELHYEADLDMVLPRADVFVLTIPMYEAVHHIIDRTRIGLLKESAILINVARGKLIDQPALIEALEQNKIAGAALDVFEQEPLPAENPLWEMKNIILTPHNSGGFSSPMARRKIGEIMIGNLERYLKGELPINIIDKETGYCL